MSSQLSRCHPLAENGAVSVARYEKREAHPFKFFRKDLVGTEYWYPERGVKV